MQRFTKVGKKICITSIVIAFTGCSVVATSCLAEQSCYSLVENKCSTCHFTNYACRKIDKNAGSLSWRYTMYTMEEMGMVVSDKEKSQLIKCLSDPDEKVRSICTSKK